MYMCSLFEVAPTEWYAIYNITILCRSLNMLLMLITRRVINAIRAICDVLSIFLFIIIFIFNKTTFSISLYSNQFVAEVQRSRTWIYRYSLFCIRIVFIRIFSFWKLLFNTLLLHQKYIIIQKQRRLILSWFFIRLHLFFNSIGIRNYFCGIYTWTIIFGNDSCRRNITC